MYSFVLAGQERFRSITKSYYRNSVGVLLVYDITNHASFEHIPLWMMEAKRHIGQLFHHFTKQSVLEMNTYYEELD